MCIRDSRVLWAAELHCPQGHSFIHIGDRFLPPGGVTVSALQIASLRHSQNQQFYPVHIPAHLRSGIQARQRRAALDNAAQLIRLELINFIIGSIHHLCQLPGYVKGYKVLLLSLIHIYTQMNLRTKRYRKQEDEDTAVYSPQ